MEAQPVMWKKLNDTMQKHDFSKLNFKGLMSDRVKVS
jgi:hypothetical protein